MSTTTIDTSTFRTENVLPKDQQRTVLVAQLPNAGNRAMLGDTILSFDFGANWYRLSLNRAQREGRLLPQVALELEQIIRREGVGPISVTGPRYPTVQAFATLRQPSIPAIPVAMDVVRRLMDTDTILDPVGERRAQRKYGSPTRALDLDPQEARHAPRKDRTVGRRRFDD